jgi:hypothetical protein
MINYQLSPKLKPVENDKFNNLIIIITFLLSYFVFSKNRLIGMNPILSVLVLELKNLKKERKKKGHYPIT